MVIVLVRRWYYRRGRIDRKNTAREEVELGSKDPLDRNSGATTTLYRSAPIVSER